MVYCKCQKFIEVAYRNFCDTCEHDIDFHRWHRKAKPDACVAVYYLKPQNLEKRPKEED